jgi:hypothetical protein
MLEDSVLLLRSGHVAELPPLDPSEEIVAATATVVGEMAVVATPRAGWPQPPDCRPRVYVHDGDQTWRAVALTGPRATYPLLDLLPDGDILVVNARCHRWGDGSVEDNAHVFDPAGAHLRSFCLGDGIEHLGVDAAGTIWVGYFDEGVFGNLGWNDPIGAAGVVRFDSHGHRLWTYQPPPGTNPIADCYALNVDARTTWAYYHTDFPLVQLTDGQARAYAPTPVRGARHLLTYRDQVIFIGEYDDPLRLADCHLTGTTVQYRGQALLHDPDGAPLHLFQPISTRGSRLYLHTDQQILIADLADQDSRKT